MEESRKAAPPIPKLPATSTINDPRPPDSSKSKSVGQHGDDQTFYDLPQNREEHGRGLAKTQSSSILCFDGGGVKSFVSLLILREIMEHINLRVTGDQIRISSGSPLKPCDIFDFIYGSSSGGLIAIMLGRLEMTVDECMERFITYADVIFSRPRLFSQLLSKVFPPKYGKKRFVRATKEVVSVFDPTTESDKWRRKTFGIPNSRCKTGVLATIISTSEPYMFRTFNCEEEPGNHDAIHIRLPLNPGPASPATIEEVARATSAAPLLFSGVNIEELEFVDGGLTVNNPSEQAIRDVAFLQQDDLTNICLVSIGSGILSGHNSSKVHKNTFSQVIRTLRDSATETGATHKTVSEICSDNEIPYFRFSPDLHKEIAIDETISPDAIVKMIAPYLEQIRDELRICASTVVSPRRSGRRQKNKRAWVVPFSRNKNFVGREDILHQLLPRIHPKADQDGCQWTILGGLGGIGKSQIALEAAVRLRDQVCSVFWVPMSSSASFLEAYYEIGRSLNIDGIEDKNADVKMLVKTALSDEDTGQWLMILDGLDDGLDFFTGNSPSFEYIPRSPNGSILCTTRNLSIPRDLGVPPSNILRVAEMKEDESIQLLNQDSEVQNPSLEDVRVLVRQLANHPLTIRQSSAYMARTGISATEFLRIFRSSERMRNDLMAKDFADYSRYSPMNTIVSIVMTSLNDISHKDPRAADCFKYLCIFDPDNIPVDLLKPKDDDDVLGTLEAIGTLKSYAFLESWQEREFYNIHPLVRHIIRDSLKTEGKLDVYVTTATQQLSSRFPLLEYTNRIVWGKYVPHALSVVELRGYCNDVHAKNFLLSCIGRCMFLLGRYGEAERFYLELLRGQETPSSDTSSPENTSTLETLGNLGAVYREQGRFKDAEDILQRILKSWDKMVGPDHHSTLESLGKLGAVYYEQGKFEDAEVILQRSVESLEKILGSDHHSTLESLANLGAVYREQGRFKDAEGILQRIVKSWDKMVGPDHPSTMESLNNLAVLYTKWGRLQEAKMILQRSVESLENMLGPDHPSTLEALNKLGVIYTKEMQYPEAEKILCRTVSSQRKILGPDHPSSLSSVTRLSEVLRLQGKLSESEEMCRNGLKGQQRSLGRDHPITLSTMHSLALILSETGKHEEAEAMYREALQGMEKSLGPQHPITRIVKDDLERFLQTRQSQITEPMEV